jgi:hypothetical protein
MQHFGKIFLMLLCFGFQTATAQQTSKPVVWYYNYFYGSDTLIFGKVYQDAAGNPLKFDRFQFYTSGIQLIHNQGDTLPFKGAYVLSSGTDGGHDLGTHLVGNPESLIFQLGVDSQTNHSDPSTYPENHALYHKIPSMHWGWETGYRFWVIEGWIDDDRDGKFNNRFEFHIVGDPLLKIKKLNNEGVVKDGKLFLVIDVDLKALLTGIDLTQNNVFHGGPWDHGSGPIIKIANNSITQPAFKSGTGFNLSSPIESKDKTIHFYPNPAKGSVSFESFGMKPTLFTLCDIKGAVVQEIAANETQTFKLSATPGLYFLITQFENGQHAVQKIALE